MPNTTEKNYGPAPTVPAYAEWQTYTSSLVKSVMKYLNTLTDMVSEKAK